MRRKTQQFWLAIGTCSILGLAVGGTTSHAASTACLDATQVTSECLTKSPLARTLEGMGTGLFVGAGAALGATWHHWRHG